MRCGGDLLHQLQLENAGDASRVSAQQRQQPVVVAAAIADAVAARIESDARHQYPVDRGERERRAVGKRLRDAAIAGGKVCIEIGDPAQLEHPGGCLDARGADGFSCRQCRGHERAGFPFAAKGKREQDRAGGSKIGSCRDRCRDRGTGTKAVCSRKFVARPLDPLAHSALGRAQGGAGDGRVLE